MLENIIGHFNTVHTLKEELQRETLPQALLFNGPIYSGKLSTALEVARVLTCETATGDWNCLCRSCQQQRLMVHPSTLLLGARYFMLEISASADVLYRTKKEFAQYLFIRAVRKLLRRFDSILWENEESRIKPALSLAVEIEESLGPLAPGHELAKVDGLSGELEKLMKLCEKLASHLKTDNIPVQQIRRVSYWAHLSSQSKKKIIILENADKMVESSRSALLKILEEPPKDLYFFLLTTRKGAMVRTILSRVRPSAFVERTEKTQTEVLQRIFREDTGSYRSLREYFLAWKGINPVELRKMALKFFNRVIDREPSVGYVLEEFPELLSSDNAAEVLLSFGEELLSLFRSFIREKPGDMPTLEVLEKWTDLLERSLIAMNTMNLKSSLVLEDLFYRMKEIR